MRVRRVTQNDIETLEAILDMSNTATGAYPTIRELGKRFDLTPKAVWDRIGRLQGHGFLATDSGQLSDRRITAEGYAALKRVGRDERTGKLYLKVEIKS